jgi:hypothetical protein
MLRETVLPPESEYLACQSGMVVLGDETKSDALVDHQHRGGQDTCFGSLSFSRRRTTSIPGKRARGRTVALPFRYAVGAQPEMWPEMADDLRSTTGHQYG